MTFQQLQMEDVISCAVCLTHFEDPRILPCQHSYCLKCLQRLVRKTEFDPENPLGGDEIVCPRCRRVASLGDKGVTGLPRNVDLDYAVEALKPILVPAPTIVGGHELRSQSPLCETHGKPLEYFCKLPGCGQPICGDCHVHSHQRHDVCKLGDAIDDAMATLRENVLDKAETVLLNVTVGIMDVERTIELLNGRREEMTGQIRERFQRIFDAFHAREQELVKLTETAVSWKVKNLRDQLDSLQQVKKELVTHVDNLKAAVSTPDGVLFLRQRNGTVTDSVMDAVQKAQGVRRKPCENSEDGPHCFIPEHVEQMAKETGGVYCKPVPSRFVAQGSSLTKAFVGKEARFTVQAHDQFGQRSYVAGATLKVEISGPEGPINSIITEEGVGNSPIGQYVVSFMPHCVGVHSVAVAIDGIPITPAPFKPVVFKSRDYHSMDKPTKVIVKSKLGPDVASVRALTITPNDQIVFTDGFYLRVLDENYALQCTFGGYGTGRGQMNLPLGIAVTKGGKPNSFYVSDSSNHRIQKFSLAGAFMSAFGEQGTQPGQFVNPEGIAVLSNDKVYVADCGNHRIQVFRQSNHKLSHVFGKLGAKPGELNSPRDVTLDLPLNRLLVADSKNNRLQAFSLEGAVLPQPGFKENVVQLEYSPCRVACDPDSFILVSHMRAVISVLTPGGSWCATWGPGTERY
eukprot:Em0005g801a